MKKLLSISVVLIMLFNVFTFQEEQNVAVFQNMPIEILEEDYIEINKTATKVTNSNDEFEIQLSVKLKELQNIDSGDIIIVIDESIQSNTTNPGYFREILNGIQNFVNDFMNENKDKIGIAVIGFSNEARIISDFLYKTHEVDFAVKQLTQNNRSALSNAEDAFIKTKQLIDASKSKNPLAPKYVIFFENKLPNKSNSVANQNAVNRAKEAYEAIKQDANFISIGLKSDIANEKAQYDSFIQSIGNLKSIFPTDMNYFNNNLNRILKETIKTHFDNIKGQNVSVEVKNAIIKDIVTDTFEIVKNSDIVTTINEDKTVSAVSSVNNQTIQWTIGTINKDGILIKFRIRRKNAYDSGENIPTNVQATLQYTLNNSSEIKQKVFKVPTVNLEPVIAEITITKKVISYNNIFIPADDIFYITFQGGQRNEKYGLSLTANQSKTIKFHLKDNQTTLLKSGEMYLTVGDFNITEKVPANYKLESINNNTFNIDKNNKNINIEITNALVNDSFFTDKATQTNTLKLVN